MGSSAEIHRYFSRAPPETQGGSTRRLDFSGRWNRSMCGVGMARKCHTQENVTRLISMVSSSGGGLPGRPGLERVSGRSLFLASFGRSLCPQGGLKRISAWTPEGSVGGDREVNGDPGLSLDGVGALIVRLEVPLFDGFLSGIRQDRR